MENSFHTDHQRRRKGEGEGSTTLARDAQYNGHVTLCNCWWWKEITNTQGKRGREREASGPHPSPLYYRTLLTNVDGPLRNLLVYLVIVTCGRPLSGMQFVSQISFWGQRLSFRCWWWGTRGDLTRGWKSHANRPVYSAPDLYISKRRSTRESSASEFIISKLISEWTANQYVGQQCRFPEVFRIRFTGNITTSDRLFYRKVTGDPLLHCIYTYPIID